MVSGVAGSDGQASQATGKQANRQTDLVEERQNRAAAVRCAACQRTAWRGVFPITVTSLKAIHNKTETIRRKKGHTLTTESPPSERRDKPNEATRTRKR